MHIPELYPRPIKPKYLVIQLKKRKKKSCTEVSFLGAFSYPKVK